MAGDLDPCRECGTPLDLDTDWCPNCGIANPHLRQIGSGSDSKGSHPSTASSASNQSMPPNYLRVAAIVVLSLFALVVVVLIARRMLYLNVWSYLSEKMNTGWNLNRDLAKAIAAIVWLPFFYFLVASLSFKKARRYVGLAGLSIYVSTFFAVAWAANRDSHFSDSHGQPYVAITPEGCIYSDRPGRDLTYGRERVHVTPAIVDACRAIEKGEDTCHGSLDEIPLLFNPSSNEPLVWYTRITMGEYCFYLSPGFDPSTGVRRAPLTPSNLQRIKEEIRRREEAIALEKAEAERSEALRQDSIRRAREALAKARAEQESLTARRSFWNRFVYVDALLASQSRPTIFVAARSDGSGPFSSFEEQLAARLQEVGLHSSRFMRAGAYDGEVFARLRSGDRQLVHDLGIGDSRSFMLVVQVKVMSPRRSLATDIEVYETEIEVFGRLMSLHDGADRTISLVAPGAGFHRDEAVQQARERSIKQLVQEIS